jgi:hypothetical protein
MEPPRAIRGVKAGVPIFRFSGGRTRRLTGRYGNTAAMTRELRPSQITARQNKRSSALSIPLCLGSEKSATGGIGRLFRYHSTISSMPYIHPSTSSA